MRFYEFILEDFKTAKVAFANQGADPAAIDQTIATYRDLTRKNQFHGNEKNIDYWAKQGWEAFKNRVDIIAQTPSKTALKRSKVQGRAIELQSPNPKWEIYIPLDKEASCNIGSGTDWCTTKRNQNYFESYFYDKGVILVYLIGNQTKYAIAMHKDLSQMEFFTKNDYSIKQQEFEAKTGVKVEDIKAQVMQHVDEITAEQKAANVKDPERALKYAKETGKRFPEGEKAIASNGFISYEYASEVLHDRFELGEPMIAREASPSYFYAKNVIKGRWEPGEPAIVKDPRLASLYARYVLKSRWPEAEPYILQDPEEALRYAVQVIKGRFPEYEPIALKKAATAWEYIKWVIKGPWPAAEPILKTSSQYQGYYEQLTGKKL